MPPRKLPKKADSSQRTLSGFKFKLSGTSSSRTEPEARLRQGEGTVTDVSEPVPNTSVETENRPLITLILR
ncbi:hypothetical protein BaRGS_00008279 [Batillaria attramentaria]|uniref:Uncharacterized protein n=1 Tax=Batillaria attramentaria TaxID=370345 RepID=A0ABD0LLD1_9CAEN